jgi:hypothetical protein
VFRGFPGAPQLERDHDPCRWRFRIPVGIQKQPIDRQRGFPALAAARDSAPASALTRNARIRGARFRLAPNAGTRREFGSPHESYDPTPASPDVEASVMRSFQEAWAAVDVERIVALLTDDAVLTMPPIDVRIEGAAAVGEFFATEPLDGHIDRIELIPTRASGQPIFACYADEHATGEHAAYGVMVFALRGDRIAGITGFPQDKELFEQLGAPLALTMR